MLFLVIERFPNGDPAPVGERFRRLGRMMPEGVVYHASWVETNGARCYQIMEAPGVEAIGEWTRHWDDLVDFEVIPVLESADFWAGRSHSG
ncbi:MAG TPA: DUF3303 family protein [Verrucomicrobiae bacterium]|nr:DUF3303 family protein [Verrucomicrobiae bacterium]